LRDRTTKPVVAAAQAPAPASKVPEPEGTLAKVDDFLREPEKSSPEATVKPIPRERPATTPPGPSRMPSSPSPVRREAPETNPPVAVKSNAPSAPRAISVSPKVPPSPTLRPIPATRPKPRLVESDAKPAPPQPNARLEPPPRGRPQSAPRQFGHRGGPPRDRRVSIGRAPSFADGTPESSGDGAFGRRSADRPGCRNLAGRPGHPRDRPCRRRGAPL